MSWFGNWLYYRRKFKLIVLPSGGIRPANKKILALTYERNWQLPDGCNVTYFDVNSNLTITGSPDLVIEREFNDGKAEYSFVYDHVLKNKSPKAFWFIDAHVADLNRVRYCDHFDFVFVAQSPYLELVKKKSRCKNIFWLPLCFPGTNFEITENVLPAKYPISFVGTFGSGYGKRNEMISFLQKEYGNSFHVVTDYKNSKTLIQQSKIATNYSLKNDLNFRVFEALGFGTELVTNYVPDIDRIEGLKERVHCFSDHPELKNNIDKLLADSVSCKHNVTEAQAWIKKHHTIKQRLAEMLQMINTGKQVEYK